MRQVWVALGLLLLAGCGEDSATQTGGPGGNTYPDGSTGGDSSLNLDAAVDQTVDTTVDQAVDTGGGCGTCSPAEIPFDADGGTSAQVAIWIDETELTCQSFTGYRFPETIVIDDMGSTELMASFGEGWTPSNASAGMLEFSEGGSFWGWSAIPRATSVSVTVTHTNGTVAVLTFTANEPAFSSVTIDEVCFQ